MGCGRVGSSLANTLDVQGHSVAIVDQDPSAFRKVSPEFGGKTVVGVGFDRDTLLEAGIERADAFAAVSSGDNSNILSARVARETYRVPHVVARIYDPRRAEIYERLGISTVASVAWTTDQMLRRLLPGGAVEEWYDPTGTIALAEVGYDQGWIGHRIKELEEASGARIAFITRFGAGKIPDKDTVVQEGDLLHAILRRDQRAAVERFFSAKPGGAA